MIKLVLPNKATNFEILTKWPWLFESSPTNVLTNNKDLLRSLKFEILGTLSYESNILICYLNSVPQTTLFLLTGVMISSKTNPCSSSKKQKRGNGESLKMSTFLSLIQILYLKQQSNILRCFSSLKFDKKFT